MSDLRWSYAINQWRTVETDLARLDQMESAFKVVSVGGFDAIEITDNALGGHIIPAYFGSAVGFMTFLQDCGLSGVSSWFSGLDHGNPANPDDHARIAAAAAHTAASLAELGGSCLVVSPSGPSWKDGTPTEDAIRVLADCWNAVGAATRGAGVRIALHPEFLGSVRTPATIGALLAATDPALVHLAVDTAELTIAGIDPAAFVAEHAARAAHVHLKDAKTIDVHGDHAAKNAVMEYWPTPIITAGAERGIDRWFYEMGTPGGLVDFAAVLRALDGADYDGWLVVESDQSPHPEESVLLNAWYRKRLLAGAPALAA